MEKESFCKTSVQVRKIFSEPQNWVNSVSVPGTSRYSIEENHRIKEGRSWSDPQPEVRTSFARSPQTSDPKMHLTMAVCNEDFL